LRDPSKADSISIRQAYGGGTNGVPAPWRYGKTTGYTGNPFQDRFSRQDWLITHEFHHQLDALLEASGYPEYYHADQPWKMPGRFGEDFDFNAQIIRNAGTDWWLNMKYGTLEQTKDADHDGLPDDDPMLPFDEKRLNGSSHTVDTDRDGLTDLQETMAGSSRGTRIDSARTDEDTLADGSDPEPIYEFEPVIRRHKGAGSLPHFANLRAESLVCDIRCGWTSDSLHVTIRPEVANRTPARFSVLFQIDAKSDGWFHGFDNFQVRVQATPDSLKTVDYYLRDCSSWTEPPRDRKDILNTNDLLLRRLYSSHTLDADSGEIVGIRFAIPRYDQFGLTLEPGKKISIRVGIQTTDDRWVWEELFERNYMMQVEFVDEP
jgi:hypothetical protein